MSNKKLETLCKVANKFNKLAQELSVTTDSSLEDSFRTRFGGSNSPIYKGALDLLYDFNIWNITVKLSYTKPNVSLKVAAMSDNGPEALAAISKFENAINAKYAKQLSGVMAQKRPAESSFSFDLISGLTAG